MVLVKVVNVTKSTVHVSNPSTVLGAGMSMMMTEEDLQSNREILGAISANILEVRGIDPADAGKKNESESVVEQDADSMKEIESVRFSDVDLESDAAGDSSFVKSRNGVIQVDPKTAESVASEPQPAKDKEYIDGIEVLSPVVDKTVKVGGVDMVIDDDGEPEYDDAFVDPNI